MSQAGARCIRKMLWGGGVVARRRCAGMS